MLLLRSVETQEVELSRSLREMMEDLLLCELGELLGVVGR